MSRLTLILILSTFGLLHPGARASPAKTVGGYFWEDANANGLREAGEPVFTNTAVGIAHSFVYEPYFIADVFATNYTDETGYYEFTGITNDVFHLVSERPPLSVDVPKNVGADRTIDSDFTIVSCFCGVPQAFLLQVTNVLPSYTNLDAGIFFLTPEITLSVFTNGQPVAPVNYVTNEAFVTVVSAISNSGNAYLSEVIFVDSADIVDFSVSCPDDLSPGEIVIRTNQFQVTGNMTNNFQAIAFPVILASCQFDGTNVPNAVVTSIYFVVDNPHDIDGDRIPNDWEIEHGLSHTESNAPAANADGDWMTDLEEYFADTDPTNNASFLPGIRFMNGSVYLSSTSTNRVYQTWWSTNLTKNLDDWSLMPPEQTGTGSAISFSTSNDAPAIIYRTGVRTP